MTLHSPLASPSATRAVLADFGLSTRKALGQHFLVDDGVVGRIVQLAGVEPGDKVLEVGPGIGTLTLALAGAGAQIIAIEKDKNLIPVLEQTTAPFAQQVVIRNEDALASGAGSVFDGQPFKFVANLPYEVAATIVLQYFQSMPGLGSATVMVQSEVAERMMAGPGSKSYGAYTVKLGLLARPTGHFSVKPSVFLPPPRVDSAVIRLERLPEHEALSNKHLAAAFTVAEAAFAQRRKTIRNSMRSCFKARRLDPQVVDTLLEQARVSPQIRGEALSVQQYRQMGRLLLES